MSDHSKSMKEVVSRLREDGVEALLDILELDVAVGELTLAGQTLAAGISEIARDATELAEAPPLASPGRLRALAAAANQAGEVARGLAGALLQLKHGLDAWSITPARPVTARPTEPVQ